MFRRAIAITLLATLLLASGAQSASGWANGGRGKDGVPKNGIGTHDWILGRAMAIAGSDARWINKTVALRATDDPDSYNADPYWHVFKEKGTPRGGPYAVSLYYEKAVQAYQAGDYRLASKYVGVLSHYYADVCQPFHTTNKGNKYRKLHVEYEHDVSAYQHKLSNVTSWVKPRPYQPVTNIRAKTIAAAKYARARYPALFRTYRRSHNIKKGGTPRRITKQVQSRAANDLADIIRTIPTGKGMAPLPAKLTIRNWRYHPRQHQSNGTFVTALDANGRPMEGVGVKFTYQLPSGTKTVTRYTGTDGATHYWQNLGATPLMQVKFVTATAPASGQTTSTAAYYMVTKPLASGTAGFKSTLSVYRARPNSNVTLTAQARDTSGKPVAGLPIRFTWSMDGYAAQTVVTTDANGLARCTRVVASAASGTKVIFRAQAQSGGYDYSYGPSFTLY